MDSYTIMQSILADPVFRKANTGLMWFDCSSNYTGMEKVMPFVACFTSASNVLRFSPFDIHFDKEL